VDREKGAGSPPGELGSFDLAKMSEAEVAAQIAARMVQWRRAHKPPEAPARKPPDRPTAPQPVIRPLTPPPSLGEAAAIRIDRALRLAAGRLGPQTEKLRTRSARLASAYRTDFKALLAEGPNMNAAGMRPAKGRIDLALGRALAWVLAQARALGVAAWRAPMHWPAIASAALIAAAIAGWILMPPERSVAPEVASAPEAASPPVAIHPPNPAPATAGLANEPQPASEALTPIRQDAIPPEKVAASAPTRPTPEWRGPILFARLKPAVAPAPALAPAQPAGRATTRPDTRQQDTVPLNATPQTPGAASNPHRMEQ
jgi:hypothetical protein